jgi:hypothetical protein
MTLERLIEDVRHGERGADARGQQQLEATRGAVRRLVCRSSHQPADGNAA